MPFSRADILEAFEDAQQLGKGQRTYLEALAMERERILAASRERAARWRANPANREKKRRTMRTYRAQPEVKEHNAKRNRTEEVRAKNRQRWAKRKKRTR